MEKLKELNNTEKNFNSKPSDTRRGEMDENDIIKIKKEKICQLTH